MSWLHLNRKGTGLLCKNFTKCVEAFCVPHEKVVYKDDISDLANKSNIDKLKKLQINNPQNILFAYLNIKSVSNKI